MLPSFSVPPFPVTSDALWLAPLAGFSDLPFRLLCREQGAAVACTEMVSAKGLIYGLARKKNTTEAPDASFAPNGARLSNSGTEDLLSTVPEDRPLVVQLFGGETDFMAQASAVLAERGYTAFDINMGCSVPKVTKTGAGAAMLQNPAHAAAVAKAVVRAAAPCPVGVKIRLGWKCGEPVYLELARALEDAGAAWITLHPRFARQGFSGTADWRALAELRHAVSLPVIASGDLFTARDAVDCLAATGASGVMFARGALSNPMVFTEYRHLLAGIPYSLAPADLRHLIMRHAALARQYTPGRPGKKGFSPALLKMRTFVPRYLRNFPGIRQLRQDLAKCESWDGLTDIVDGYFDALSPQGHTVV